MTTSEVDYDSDPDDYITVYTSKWTFSLRLSNTLVSLSTGLPVYNDENWYVKICMAWEIVNTHHYVIDELPD